MFSGEKHACSWDALLPNSLIQSFLLSMGLYPMTSAVQSQVFPARELQLRTERFAVLAGFQILHRCQEYNLWLFSFLVKPFAVLCLNMSTSMIFDMIWWYMTWYQHARDKTASLTAQILKIRFGQLERKSEMSQVCVIDLYLQLLQQAGNWNHKYEDAAVWLHHCQESSF